MVDTGGRVLTSNLANPMLMRLWDVSSMRFQWPGAGVPVASSDNNEGDPK